MECKHNDCLHFANIDVAKGICRLNGEIIEIDTKVCDTFVAKPKCKFCKNFKDQDKDGIGMCIGLESESWVYGELNAVTCPSFDK